MRGIVLMPVVGVAPHSLCDFTTLRLGLTSVAHFPLCSRYHAGAGKQFLWTVCFSARSTPATSRIATTKTPRRNPRGSFAVCAPKPSRRVADCVLTSAGTRAHTAVVCNRSPRHEERAQDAPLSSVWCRWTLYRQSPPTVARKNIVCKAFLPRWCRWWGSNPHGVTTLGF